MERNFELLCRTADFLGWAEQKHILEQTQQTLDDGAYFVAFVGQYSAGKSRLINNLLRRDLLPLGVTETTPLLTYIRYGENEEAKLHYCDAAVQAIPIEQVKKLRQGSSDWDTNSLEYLEIFLPEDLLSNGMILLDTPGVNTVIQRHQHLLADSLALASKVVYVAGHALSRSDLDVLDILIKRGLDLSFVRTHFDALVASEDDPEDVRQQDIAFLSSYGFDAGTCYHVSNLAESKWYGAIDALRDMLVEKGVHAHEELEQAADGKLAALAHQFIAALDERKADLEAVRDHNDEALKAKCEEIDRQIQVLEQSVHSREEQMKEKLEQYKRRLRGEVQRAVREALRDSAGRIERAGDNVTAQRDMVDLLTNEARAWLNTLHAEIRGVCGLALDDVNEETCGANISWDTETALPTVGSYEELTSSQDRRKESLQRRIREVQQNRLELEKELNTNAAACTELCQSLIELENGIMELRGEYADLPPYKPQMVDISDRSMQPSEVMKNLGNVLDWLTLLTPQGKVVGALKSIGITKSLAKVIGTVEKKTKIIKSGKGIKDIADRMKKMGATYATARRIKQVEEIYNRVGKKLKADKEQSSSSGEETTGLTDYLTIEHWAEQIGKNFDTPPRRIEDEEYRKQYMEKKTSLEQGIIISQRAAHKKKCELNIYESKQARMEAERKAGIADEATLTAQLAQMENKIRASAKKAAQQRWKQDCARWYISRMEPQIDVVISKAEEELPDRIMSYQQERMSVLKEKLNSKKQECEALQQTPPGECAEQLDKVCCLLDGLKKEYHGC